MNKKVLLVSLGAAIAASKIVRSISEVRVKNVLGSVGLERKRNHALENLALVGAGAILGTGAALLLAPKSGEETRALLGREASKLGRQASKLGHAATCALKAHKDDALRSVSQFAANATGANGQHS